MTLTKKAAGTGKSPKRRAAAAGQSEKAAQADEGRSEDRELPLLIKKYPNRRLYNTATSAYIVLDDIVQLVKNGTNFVIEDTKTGEDITRSILNQIIFEQETKPANFHFPLEFQKQLIGMYGDNYGKMVPSYLTESLKLFSAERANMKEAVESVVERNTRAVMEFSQNLARQNMEMFKRSLNLFTLGAVNSRTKDDDTEKDAASDDKTSAGSGAKDARKAELKAIQDQIDALQKRLKSLSE